MPRKNARPAARKKRKAIQAAMPERPRGFPEDSRLDWETRWRRRAYQRHLWDVPDSIRPHQLDTIALADGPPEGWSAADVFLAARQTGKDRLRKRLNESYLFLAGRQCGKTDMMTEALKQVVAEGMAMVEIDPRRFPPGRIVESVPRGDDWARDRILRPDMATTWNIDSPEDCDSVEVRVPEEWTRAGWPKTITGLPAGKNVELRFDRAEPGGDITGYAVFQDGKLIKTGDF